MGRGFESLPRYHMQGPESFGQTCLTASAPHSRGFFVRRADHDLGEKCGLAPHHGAVLGNL